MFRRNFIQGLLALIPSAFLFKKETEVFFLMGKSKYFVGKDQQVYKIEFIDDELGDRVEWYQNGKLHREDGPAVICASGYQAWWKDGELHRDDAPAVIHAMESGGTYKAWWLNGKYQRCES